jgi:3-oxoacyl-[acyl-carrier protein] reductase
MQFRNMTAVITGGAGGIGKATAYILGSEGAEIVISDKDKGACDAALKELTDAGVKAHAIIADLLSHDAIKNLCEEVISQYGNIDFLVNSAGITTQTKIPDITWDEWNLLLNVNLRSVFFCSQEALKYMIKERWGKIILLSSAAGKIGGVTVGAHYAAAKAGIICLTKSLAKYAAQYNITVNSVCPGLIATDMTAAWGEETNEAFRQSLPLKRHGTPEEVGETIKFLLSDKADYITGETVDVNGGLYMD